MITRAEMMSKPEPGPQEDPWYYGWRYVEQTGPNGQLEMVQVPLTEEDVLHPQEDDFIVQNDDHTRDCQYLKTVLDAHLADRPGVHVFHDHRIDWGVEGIEPHGPDLAVVEGFPEDWDGRRGTFRLTEFGAHALLVIEVTSPTTRRWDLNEKVTEYYQAGIPYYAIVDRLFQGGEGPRLLAYRAGEGGYVLVEPDAEGWLALEPVGLALAFEDGNLTCRDAQGRRMLDYQEVLRSFHSTQSLLELEIRTRQEAQARADAEVQTRQLAQRRADEAQARADAEARTGQALQRRVELEAQIRQQVQAQADAERARAEAAEERLRQLEAEFNRLRGQT